MSRRKRKSSQPSPGDQSNTPLAVEVKTKKTKLNDGTSELVCAMNCSYTSESFQSDFQSSWKNKKAFEDDTSGVVLLSDPFQCCVLPNFFHNVDPRPGNQATEIDSTASKDEFLWQLKKELLRLKFYEKNNDLYQFHQSDDLKKFNRSPCISKLRSCFRSQVLPWLRRVTGIELSDVIDMTCSKYEFTDVLLCHDDELEGRRIAFIYYLVPEWTQEDGENGQPSEVVRSFLPVCNNFVFFDVNAVSFHQVSDVLSATKTRLSVNGWFHGPPASRPIPYKEEKLPMYPPISMGLDVLTDWINPLYLDVGVQEQIQHQFETDSQIELPDFILEEKYTQLCEEMRTSGIKWTVKGPPNQKKIVLADSTSLPPKTKECLDMILSEPFCRLLSHLTGLDLVHNVIRPENAENPSSSVHVPGEKLNQLDENADEKTCSQQTEEKDEFDNENSSSSSSRTCGSDSNKNMMSLKDSGGARENIVCLDENCDDSKLSKMFEPNGESLIKAHPQFGPHSSQVGLQEDDNPSNGESTPAGFCRGELCQWQPGGYTLAGREADPGLGKFCLDAILYFCCEGWSEDYGGMTSYIAKDADEELLTVIPTPNALSLVYRDEETLCFTKYLNHRAMDDTQDSSFCTINAIYMENNHCESDFNMSS